MEDVKAEESPQNGKEHAEPEYHYDFLKRHSSEMKKDLLEWYYKYRRKLPWRNDQPPYTTSVQVEVGNPQGDIRSYFCKGGDAQISRNGANRKDGTRLITKGRKKDQEELPLREVKRVKNECVLKNSPEECKGQSSNKVEATQGQCVTTPISNTQAEVKQEDDPLPPNEKQHLSVRGYQIYVSEIMLQQTRVHAVVNFYLKWMNKWGTIFELAKSNLDDVLILWKGLGYYNRAKNLLDCCKHVVDKYDGVFPNDLKLLKELPGIGDYTSKAICIHLYNRKDICIDTNVIRIFSRITDTINYSGSTVLTKHCERVSHVLCEGDSNYSDLSQALMDLGSSICNGTPQCAQCPLNKHCLIYLKKKNNNSKKKDSSFYLTHPDGCKLCVQDRNVEIKCVPLTKKKKKTEKICLVLLVKRSGPPKGKGTSIINKVEKKSTKKKKITLTGQKSGEHLEDDYYLMIKNTNSNLFSMHYLFPLLLLDQFDKKHVHTHLNELLSSLNLNNSLEDSFTYINNFKHVFSHLTYDTHIYVCSVLNEENVTEGKENVWIKLKDMQDFTHNSFCQNIIDHYRKSVTGSRMYLSEFCL
ncbi:A/g-specific adenine glycosylase [Plasmodium coatneyi]|uniref:Adenine DNA glycosylase n=1 Tax=Plasmodium coatneyi TaxID=208452 RepID=A0A1B1DZF0_9APIC|nr:A/g-specific adenine glycosylase [Plasmodium coatneyi]ANQ08138.1 A/g-specific adenine glycosylase [Plasmodium coatneyi]